MITILKTGYGKIMSLFYKNKRVKLHLREICRQAKLHEPSATRFLNSLEKSGILRSEKDGNLKKYSLVKSNKSYLVLEFFDIEKFEKIPLLRKNAIKAYLDKLSEKPIFAVVFGSTAKGTFNDGSDIDILLISNRKADAKEAEKEADALTAVKVSTFQMAYEDFLTEIKMKKDPVVQSALQSGYPLINHIQFYEVLYNERA